VAADQHHPLRDLGVRLLTAIGIGVAFLGSILFGGPYGVAAVITVVAVAGTAEFYAILRRERRLPNEVFGLAAVGAMPLSAAAYGLGGLTAVISVLVIISLLWHLALRQVRATDTAVTVFGVVYVGFTLSHFVLIREFDAGTELALATIVSVWANDSFAYLVGSSFGRHKLAPHISPNKSWEGFIAGSLLTIAVWVAIFFVTDTKMTLAALVGVGIAASLAAVVGDLAESRLKREVGVKDSGGLLPGHGGFLDRFDSLILVSIVTYYILILAGAR